MMTPLQSLHLGSHSTLLVSFSQGYSQLVHYPPERDPPSSLVHDEEDVGNAWQMPFSPVVDLSRTPDLGEDEEEECLGEEGHTPQEQGSDLLLNPAPPKANQAAMWSCVAVLANNMMGAGILGLPYAVAQSGWLVGGSLLLLSAVLSGHGFDLLTRSARTIHQRSLSGPHVPPSRPRPASFYTLCQVCMPRGTVLVDATVAVKCFGVAISYLVIVGDLLPDVVKEARQHPLGGPPADVWEERWVWVTLAFLLVAPLSFASHLSALRFTSGISVGIVLVLTLVALLYAGQVLNPCQGTSFGVTRQPTPPPAMASVAATLGAVYPARSPHNRPRPSRPVLALAPPCRGPVKIAGTGPAILQVLPIFVYSYTAHQNFGLLCNELANPTPRRTRQTIMAATGLSLGVYLTLAFAAYLTYGAALQRDLLLSFPASLLSTSLRAALSVLVTFTYPLQAHPARTCLLALWALWAGEETHRSGRRESCPAPLSPPLVAFRATCVTLLFLAASLLIALLVQDLSLVLEIVGATGSTAVSYLLPGLLYFYAHPWPHFRRRLALGQVLVGLAVMITCLVAIVLRER